MAVINGDATNNGLAGTDAADTINGLGGDDILDGRAGNDSLDGGTGNDTLYGEAGNDTINGGAGVDRVFYFKETGTRGISADLGTGKVTDTWGNLDTLIGIEYLYGSVFNDTIKGTATGNDTLFGDAGNDNINGLGGDDILVGDKGNDTLQGDAGSDQVAYFFETGTLGVVVNLITQTATDTWGDTDTLFNIERIIGSDHDDILKGSGAANFFYGRDGADLIETFNGVDTLVGDKGADTLDGGDSENDVLSYYLESGTLGVTVNLKTGTAIDTWGDTDTIRNLEVIHGTDKADRMIGSDGVGHDGKLYDERFIGYDGDDYMDGGDGKDYYSTGAGNDTIMVGATLAEARDTIVISGSGNKVIKGGNSEGTLYGHHLIFEIDEAITVNLKDGTASSATMTTDFTEGLYILEVNGTMHDDHLIGGNPLFDYLEWYTGNQGNDTIDGGTGTADTVIYEPEEQIGAYNFDLGRTEYGMFGVVVDLGAGTAKDAFGDTDTLINIDHVRGTNWDDYIKGSDEQNAFWGLKGNDTLDGGEGEDIVHYREDALREGNAGVTVNLFNGTAIDGHGTTDTLISIENVHATDKNDFVVGNNVDNRLFGYDGNDTLRGFGGKDVLVGGVGDDSLSGGDDHDELVGGAGNDLLDGGQGDDLVRYRDDTAGIAADLTSGKVTDGDGGIDTLISIESVHGSDFGDTLAGDGGANELSGFGGNDLIEGRTGADTLLGGTGNDTIRGGAQNDELWGGAGDDTLDGGDGTDLVRYRDAAAGVSANLATNSANDGEGGTDTFIGIEGIHGSEHNDTLKGDSAGNELSGFGGNDLIEGQDGNDTLLGGGGQDTIRGGTGDDELWGEGGNDTLDGGAGTDLVRYLSSTAAVVVDLAAGTAQDGLGGTDTLIGIEGAHGSEFGDTLKGDAGGNELSGFGGNDTLIGQGGEDTLIGGVGNDSILASGGDDTLLGGDGFDTLDGGDGTDLVRYRDDVAGVTVNLASGSAVDGAGNTDVLVNIEDIDGSDHNDKLTGSSGSNRLFGYAGNDLISGTGGSDTLKGGTGNDTLLGGDGDDEIWGEQGADSIDGGTGIDLIRYRGATGGVTVDLNGGSALDGHGAQDSLKNIENVHGSDFSDILRGDLNDNELAGFKGNDTLSGFQGNDKLLGDEGNDSLSGGGGEDELSGGAGVDTLNGGAGRDLARYRDSTSGVVVDLAAGQAQDGFGTSDTLIDIEGAHGSDFGDTLRGDTGDNELFGFDGDDTIQGSLGNDTLLGGAGNDSLHGGGGNDLMTGDAGADTLDGSTGIDLVRYRDDAAGVTVNLISGQALDGGGALDTLIDIENAHGSDFDDKLTGDVSANELSGFAGADTIAGNGGNDTILGGAGNDSLSGGANNDEIWGEAGNDTIDGGDGTDLVRYRSAGAGANVNLATGTATDGDGGNDSLTSIENAHGSDFGDTLTGNAGNNELSGFAGNDLLQGGAGVDTLLGGEGDDTIQGGDGDDEIWGQAGADNIDGGAGANDLLRYRDDEAGVTVNLTTGTATDGSGSTDTITNIEHVHTSDHNDSIVGNSAINRLFGFAGDDTMRGEAGNDILLGDGGDDSIDGGTGDDEIWGGAGADTIDGGAGTDLVRYLDAIGSVTANLATGVASSDGFGSSDVLSNVEDVDGSNFADSITGDSGANRLFGFGGRDTLEGGDGNDVLAGDDNKADTSTDEDDSLSGGGGNDTMLGEGGDDTYDGGDGTDLVRFIYATSGLNVNLLLGTATGEGNDSLSNVENIDGSNFDDLIVGDSNVNVLSGMGGADTLIGNAGNDVLSGRGGGDVYEFIAGDGNDVVNDLGGDGVDKIIFHDYYARNATVIMQNPNDPNNKAIQISFGITGDVVVIANGRDASSASAIEQIVWADGTTWSHATLIANLGQQGTVDSAGPTPLDNVLNYTPNDDVRDGLDGNDLIRGLGGNDSLSGSGGNDTLIGGEGDDTLLGGDGNDLLEGGPGNDVKDGGAGTDTAVYGVALSDAAVSLSGGVFTITSHLGTDTVSNVESFKFTDQTLTLAQMTAIGTNQAPVSTLPPTLSNSEGAVSVNFAQFFSDPEGATLTYEISGLPDGLTVSGTGLTVSGTVEGSLTPYLVRITASDALNGQVTASVRWTIENINAAPTGGVSITGTATEGQTLTADTSTLADGDGLGELSYVWMRDGVVVAGADTQTYHLTAADIGAQMSVKVSYTDGFGTAESVSSTATSAVLNVNSLPTGGVSISGTPTEGQTLTAQTSSLADADGLGALRLQWLRDTIEIEGANGATYTLGDDDIGARIRLRVTYTDQQGTFETVTSSGTTAVRNVNDAPTGSVVIEGSPSEGQTLSADTSTLDDGDGMGALSYQWLRNDNPISGANSGAYTLTADDIGGTITVKVSYTDAHGTAESVTSAATAAVTNTNDAPTGAVVIDGTVSLGQTLTANTSTLSDADGVGQLSYQWMRDGTAITGATASTYKVVTADIGSQLTVVVSYEDGGNTQETVTSDPTATVISGNELPTGKVVITGTAAQHETLGIDSSTLADANGMGNLSYQWLRDGTAITGAKGATYTLVTADIGKKISVKVSYTDGIGTQESVTSAATAAVSNANDGPSGTVVLTGTAKQGETLTADLSGLSDEDGLGTVFTYQWQRGGVDIAGATSASYTLAQADVDQAITVKVGYTDGIGTEESVTSAASAPVENINDAPVGKPIITGKVARGETVTADGSGVTDADGIASQLFYEWFRDGTKIMGANSETYTIQAEDDGANLTVKLKYTDQFSQLEEVFSDPVNVNDANDAPTGSIPITGDKVQGATLTADVSNFNDPDGLGTLNYQWLRDDAEVSGATGQTYVLTQADVGAQISVRVSYTDQQGYDESVTTGKTMAIANVNDAPVGKPVLTGTPNPGNVLTMDTSGLSDPDGIASNLFFEWFRDGTKIPGALAETYTLTSADLGTKITGMAKFVDGGGTQEEVFSTAITVVEATNTAPAGALVVTGTAKPGQVLTADASGITDVDGIQSNLFYEWFLDGTKIPGELATTYTVRDGDAGHSITALVKFVDGLGKLESVTSSPVAATSGVTVKTGTAGNDRLEGTDGADSLVGLGGNDTLIGAGGDDTLEGGDGVDVLNGGDGDDFIYGGATEADLRDVVYGGNGNDYVEGGYGNDELRGDAGNDTLAGGFGADTMIGGDGDDQVTGSAWGDVLFGGNGDDFINGGFGYDRVNGGTGADQFFHIGNAGHGSDWIQDYNAAEGDVLFYGASAVKDDFLIQRATTASAGADTVQEVFITNKTTGVLLWALVDGDAQSELNVKVGANVFDLLA
ncbi:calcium-binding protein [Pseudoprimorskyibacter insulae]|uniref:Bifunctional hemolysin/adenylate cyclase n=1 Tax=Pseudoprimorskyibacter insulae TaxID=1695997 RepID=A0A2R8B0N0_9RHOB|nr:calcium-binding protein [Pseudoprimorskyibacter insulae]SPF81790.1 Bifunctional hemolysin/adenylate cyclase [Pseudoprimorskyibacter insulae]